MKKMDEMDRNIQLRSKEWGYHTAMLALAGWSLFNSFRTLTEGMAYNPLPGLILCAHRYNNHGSDHRANDSP